MPKIKPVLAWGLVDALGVLSTWTTGARSQMAYLRDVDPAYSGATIVRVRISVVSKAKRKVKK